MTPAERDDLWTIAAAAALAFVTANVLHEVVGHGLPYFLQGGREALFTPARPVFGRPLSEQAGLWIDLGGPAVAILAGGLAAIAATRPGGSRAARLFLAACGAFCLFWNVGYLPWSLVAGEGDWAQIARALGVPASIQWAAGAAGAVVYAGVALAVRGLIGRMAGDRDRARRLGRTLWLAGSAIAAMGGMFDPRGAAAGVTTGILAGAVAASPLLWTADPAGASSAALPVVERRRVWQASSLVAAILYVVWFGPGVGVTL